MVWYPTGISVSGVNQGLHILYKEPTTVDIYWTILYRGRAIRVLYYTVFLYYTCIIHRLPWRVCILYSFTVVNNNKIPVLSHTNSVLFHPNSLLFHKLLINMWYIPVLH